MVDNFVDDVDNEDLPDETTDTDDAVSSDTDDSQNSDDESELDGDTSSDETVDSVKEGSD